MEGKKQAGVQERRSEHGLSRDGASGQRMGFFQG